MPPSVQAAKSSLPPVCGGNALAIAELDSPAVVQAFPNGLCRVYVGTGGDIGLVPARGIETVVYRNVKDGTTLSVFARAIDWSRTTASDIVIEW
jgi:hypothetical protein